ncbi:hypothetical protein BB559_005009, partial [Furculomyces boomerangus]
TGISGLSAGTGHYELVFVCDYIHASENRQVDTGISGLSTGTGRKIQTGAEVDGLSAGTGYRL